MKCQKDANGTFSVPSLEVFFLSNALIAILGVIATVNGKTAVEGVSEVNVGAFLGIVGLVLLGGVVGFLRFAKR